MRSVLLAMQFPFIPCVVGQRDASCDGADHVAKGSFYDEELSFYLCGWASLLSLSVVRWFSSYSVKTRLDPIRSSDMTKSDCHPTMAVKWNKCNNFATKVLSRRLNGRPYSPREWSWSSGDLPWSTSAQRLTTIGVDKDFYMVTKWREITWAEGVTSLWVTSGV